jgi:hypothetical protein
MSNQQLYLASGIPMLFNAAIAGLIIAYINARIDGLEGRFKGIEAQFEAINQRFEAINQRFDDMRDLWRAELHRVEEIIGARLRHLEERWER